MRTACTSVFVLISLFLLDLQRRVCMEAVTQKKSLVYNLNRSTPNRQLHFHRIEVLESSLSIAGIRGSIGVFKGVVGVLRGAVRTSITTLGGILTAPFRAIGRLAHGSHTIFSPLHSNSILAISKNQIYLSCEISPTIFIVIELMVIYIHCFITLYYNSTLYMQKR